MVSMTKHVVGRHRDNAPHAPYRIIETESGRRKEFGRVILNPFTSPGMRRIFPHPFIVLPRKQVS